MNMTHLKYAAEVARTGSISQAAENLFMSQPNLSKAIKEFESRLGFAIFRRTSRGMEPTAKGADFLAFGENILADIAEMERLYIGGEDLRSKFSIAVPRASYITHAFTVFLNGMDRAEALDFNFEETGSIKATDAVASGRCDLGIARCRLDDKAFFYRLFSEKGLGHRRIFTYEYRLLLSAEHPLAKEAVVGRAALEQYTEILHGDRSVPFLRDDGAKREGRRKIYVYERGSQFDLLRKVKDTYMWVSPMPRELLRCYGLTQKKCDSGSHRYCDLLIFKNGHHFTKNENLFLEQLDTVIAEISKG